MKAKPQPPPGHNSALSLDEAINALDLSGNTVDVESAKDAFDSACALLRTIRVGLSSARDHHRPETVPRIRQSTKRTVSNWG